jgi:hypothetical protein
LFPAVLKLLVDDISEMGESRLLWRKLAAAPQRTPPGMELRRRRRRRKRDKVTALQLD